MKKLIGLLVVTGLSATPVTASVRDAAFSSSADQAQSQSGMFVGVHYRLSSNRDASAPRGRATFKMSGMAQTPGTSDFKLGSGLEFAVGKSGKPTLFVAGREAGKLGDQAHLGTGGTIALAVVGLAVVAGAVAALTIDARLDRQNSE